MNGQQTQTLFFNLGNSRSGATNYHLISIQVILWGVITCSSNGNHEYKCEGYWVQPMIVKTNPGTAAEAGY